MMHMYDIFFHISIMFLRFRIICHLNWSIRLMRTCFRCHQIFYEQLFLTSKLFITFTEIILQFCCKSMNPFDDKPVRTYLLNSFFLLCFHIANILCILLLCNHCAWYLFNINQLILYFEPGLIYSFKFCTEFLYFFFFKSV